ncbi:cytochrome c-type biogenesis protein CcmH [Wolbachia endosymbiont of Litomosoides sigmodontis]|uniref:cytochrome c-type biogenesis protein n=1 Tax=Wolbachia endosymbiont of Litomosoides sigmodontis TaxID=80850 RepID=UPI00158C73FA|nr:cytochrome c-type biogenesis protein CcmH [Wolbachia endosymbiont of Litomosoides sigmodontis]QKX03304.1 cytochrome c-type biogenesis protein CcmH [Wolbachia endosymbiont of Litomosoides sigmodontis]
MKILINLFFILIFYSSTNAFILDNKLRDKSMEKRATNLFKMIKCPICSGESLSESGSQIAYDMRKMIREKISHGYTDEQITLELRNFYGDSIIIAPPVKFSTYILWLIPLVIPLIGCFLIRKYT